MLCSIAGLVAGFVVSLTAKGPLSTLSSEVLCVQERPVGRGNETTGPPSARIFTGVADVVTTGAGDREHNMSLAALTLVGVDAFGAVMRTGEWLPILIRDAGL